jgi:intein/homing endonuclease
MWLPRSHFKVSLPDDRVVTIEGEVKQYKDLHVGDCLPSLNTETLKMESQVVTAIAPDTSQFVRVNLKGGRHIECGDQHGLLEGNKGWVNAEDLEPGDRIGVARWRPGGHPGDDESYLVGLIYGDGSVTSGQISITNVEPEITEFLYSYWKEVTHIESHMRYDLRGGREWWEGLDLPSDKAIYKTIPQKYEGDASFLCGLFDTDGTCSKQAVQFTTASDALADDVLRNLQYFGVYATKCRIETPSPHGRAWILSVYEKESLVNFKERVGFRVKRKMDALDLLAANKSDRSVYVAGVPSKWKEELSYGDSYSLTRAGIGIQNNYWTSKAKVKRASEHLNLDLKQWYDNDVVWVPVESVEYTGKKDAIHIEVSGDQNYLDAQGVVNHNSTICSEAFPLWLLACVDRNITIALVSAKEANTVQWVTKIKNVIEHNSFFRALFPHIRRGDKWEEGKITVTRDKGVGQAVQASITALSIGSGLASQHFDYIICDDLVNEQTAKSVVEMDKAVSLYQNLEELLKGWHDSLGFMVVGTPWGREDVIHKALREEQSGWRVKWGIGALGGFECSDEIANHPEMLPDIEDGKPILPSECDEEKLRYIKEEHGEELYHLNYLCKPFDEGRSGFHLNQIQNYSLRS